MQAKHWSCLRGLLPADPPSLPLRPEHRQTPLSSMRAANPVLAPGPNQPGQEAQETSYQAVVDNANSHMPGTAAGFCSEQQSRKSGQAKAWPQSAKDLYTAGCHHADPVVSREDGRTSMMPADSKPVHADSQHNAPVGTVSDSAAVHAHNSSKSQSVALHARRYVVPSSNANVGDGMQAGVPVSTAQVSHDQRHTEHVADPADRHEKAHQNVADHSSKHGHRLLAEGQESHSHAAKAGHRPKLPLQMCQGKSHQRLLLMTALHVSAHKQMKRQHKCVHAGAHETATKRLS